MHACNLSGQLGASEREELAVMRCEREAGKGNGMGGSTAAPF